MPNSAHRLEVDKEQGLRSEKLTCIRLVLPSVKLKLELTCFIPMSLNHLLINLMSLFIKFIVCTKWLERKKSVRGRSTVKTWIS